MVASQPSYLSLSDTQGASTFSIFLQGMWDNIYFYKLRDQLLCNGLQGDTVKLLLIKRHKYHDWHLNLNSADQKHQSLKSSALNHSAMTRHNECLSNNKPLHLKQVH